MAKIDWLKPHVSIVNDDGDTVYSLKEARQGNEVKELDGGWFVYNIKDDLHVNFAVFHLAYSDDKDTMMECVFQGSGPSGSLRECRHTWWGDDEGYVFYPPGKLIAQAFQELSVFFDDMTSTAPTVTSEGDEK